MKGASKNSYIDYSKLTCNYVKNHFKTYKDCYKVLDYFYDQGVKYGINEQGNEYPKNKIIDGILFQMKKIIKANHDPELFKIICKNAIDLHDCSKGVTYYYLARLINEKQNDIEESICVCTGKGIHGDRTAAGVTSKLTNVLDKLAMDYPERVSLNYQTINNEYSGFANIVIQPAPKKSLSPSVDAYFFEIDENVADVNSNHHSRFSPSTLLNCTVKFPVHEHSSNNVNASTVYNVPESELFTQKSNPLLFAQNNNHVEHNAVHKKGLNANAPEFMPKFMPGSNLSIFATKTCLEDSLESFSAVLDDFESHHEYSIT